MDLGAFDFKMKIELEIQKNQQSQPKTKANKQRNWKKYLVLVLPRKACLVHIFELNRIRFKCRGSFTTYYLIKHMVRRRKSCIFRTIAIKEKKSMGRYPDLA